MTDLLKVLDVVGYISICVVIVGSAAGVILWMNGILPVLFRLGSGLAGRKIAVLARGSNLNSLRSLLTDSRIFREKHCICRDGLRYRQGRGRQSLCCQLGRLERGSDCSARQEAGRSWLDCVCPAHFRENTR